MRVAARIACMCLMAAAAGCDNAPTAPSPGGLATITVGNETFRVGLTTPEQIQAARLAQAGGTARIPNGRIVAGTQVNTGWNWHLTDVEFAELAMELCDGRPSDVEREGPSYGGGRFCPWGATVVRVDDL